MATFGTFVAGQVLTAAELNGAGAWQDYTPSWTQSATISKTVNWARYMQLNKLVIGSVKMTATSAGTANNIIAVGLPVTASSNNFMLGTAGFVDASASTGGTLYPSVAVYGTSTTMYFYGAGSGESAYLTGQMGLTASQYALTVASDDVIYVQFVYEAA